MNPIQVAKALGWFSIVLGVIELLAPGWLARQIGVGEHSRVMRAFGLREIASGLGILVNPEQPAGLWARLGGDALDLATLGNAARAGDRQRAAFAIGMVAGLGLIDAIYARRLQRQSPR